MTTEDILTRGVENIIPNTEKLRSLLESGKKLNVYLGIDPTATQIHIGHAVPLRKLQALSEMGHNVTFLIGDFTALIGDTSDKDTERPVLTSEQIKANFETYKKQAEKIVDFDTVTVRFNSEWLSKLTFADIVKLTQHFSAGTFVGRELIKKRLQDGKKVGLHELLYPVMQGYDSYFMDTDIQLGGTDQTFNMQAGRTLQRDLRDKESYIIANGFLEGTDGRKMSKSWGNAIWLSDEPNDMYGKVMSLKDDLIISYFTLSTNLSREEIEAIKQRLDSEENPVNIKKELAHQIVLELHSSEAADNAQEHFEKTVQGREVSIENAFIANIEEKETNVVDAIKKSAMTRSKSDLRRLCEQGGISIKFISGEVKKIVNSDEKFETASIEYIKVGKRDVVKIKGVSESSQIIPELDNILENMSSKG
ncbi:MAG: tyrosine--tRNA ligase [Candidatus Woesebacteria bacterium]